MSENNNEDLSLSSSSIVEPKNLENKSEHIGLDLLANSKKMLKKDNIETEHEIKQDEIDIENNESDKKKHESNESSSSSDDDDDDDDNDDIINNTNNNTNYNNVNKQAFNYFQQKPSEQSLDDILDEKKKYYLN